MLFADKTNFKQLSESLIRLGFLMAGGNPDEPKSQKQISVLSSALSKIDLNKNRLIENMRFFHETCLTENQKLRVYETLLKTLGRPQSNLSLEVSIRYRNFSFEEKEAMCLKSIERNTGMWAGFAVVLGSVIAAPSNCSQKILDFGIRFGVTLQMLKDLENRFQADQQAMALEKAHQELSILLQKIQAEFDLPETSPAFQLAETLGKNWTHLSH